MATRRAQRLQLGLPRTALAAGAAAALVLLTGCSGVGSDSDDSGGGSAAEAAAGMDSNLSREGAESGGGAEPAVDAPGTGSTVEQQKIISTGSVQLRTDDVGQAVFDVRKVVDSYRGTVSEDNTETDDDGKAFRSRMVLRIPTADFGDAMAELEDIATLVASKRQSADVTTQVLDTDVRVEAQQRSIDRIQVLFENASTIKDVVSIESELSRRQADLASLQAQQRYLADQTSMSTITVAVERTPVKVQPKPKDNDEAGFLAGLSGGWKALKAALVVLATIAGALLPWLVLAVLLAVPGWPLARRLRRRAVTAHRRPRPSLGMCPPPRTSGSRS